jgi:ubiquinone/menaquinone biosynthesis C-methylase UbiE
MNLLELVQRGVPQPWSEGDNIPWNDPDFSRRMLKEHLTQDHDAASRRLEIIDRHVHFIHTQVLKEEPSRILDIGCGPGLYTHRLARLGHTLSGIDFSPAAVEYARRVAESESLACTYTLSDVRAVEIEPLAYDLVMFIFGDFNVFCPEDARAVLHKAQSALKPGGVLLLEPSTEAGIRKIGAEAPVWYTAQVGLFSDHPHLMLHESYWDEPHKAATNRHIVVDAASGLVTRFAASYQAYTQDELRLLLEACGFGDVCFYPSLTGCDETGDFWAVTAVCR